MNRTSDKFRLSVSTTIYSCEYQEKRERDEKISDEIMAENVPN